MKNAITTFFVLTLCCFVSSVFAQDYFHSYSGVDAQTIAGSEVDSIIVETPETIRFYGGGNVLLTLTRTDVDSMLVNASVPFAISPAIWEVKGEKTTQYWTDWIAYDGDNKREAGTLSSMSMGETPDYRDNAGYKGFYYNWYYINEHKDKICPCSFRLPVADDFKNLDIALGGTGETQSGLSAEREQMYVDWGLDDASKGGRINNNAPQYAGSYVYLWTLTDVDATHASQFLYNFQSHNVAPVNNSSSITKSFGLPVRCVRDGEPDVPPLPIEQNVTAAPGFNRIMVKWEQNPDPSIESVVVYWNDRANSMEIPVVIREPGCFQTDSVFISGLTEGQDYQFEMVNKYSDGSMSAFSDLTRAVAPYGEVYKASLTFRQVSFIGMAAFDAVSHTGTVNLEFVAAGNDFIGQSVSYKDQVSGSQVEQIVADDNVTLSNVGNKLLDPEHLIYLKSLYLPEGGIDVVETGVYKTQICAFVAPNPTESTIKRWEYNAGKQLIDGEWVAGTTNLLTGQRDPVPDGSGEIQFGTYNTQTKVAVPTANNADGIHPDKDAAGYTKYIWADSAQIDITAFRMDRVGSYGPDTQTRIKNGMFDFKLKMAPDNKVAVSGWVQSANGHHEDYVLVENGAAFSDSDADHSPGDGTPQSIYDPATGEFSMNYAVWRIGKNASNHKAVVFVCKLVPR